MGSVAVAPPRPLVYGTSGFRATADEQLQIVVRKAAFYAAVRAKKLQKTVGIMITASHNLACDNGLKLVDPSGGMLAMECEEELTRIANSSDREFAEFQEHEIRCFIEDAEKGEVMKDSMTTTVVLATDTRPSSPLLYAEAVKGIRLLSAEAGPVDIKFFENHTTPQLHYIVWAINEQKPVEDYLQQFRRALTDSLKFLSPNTNNSPIVPSSPLFVDCANGVGALWVRKYLSGTEMFTFTEDCGGDVAVGNGQKREGENNNIAENSPQTAVAVTLFNTNTANGIMLNNGCGADFVKINARLPANFTPSSIPCGARCAALDGDADRLVYFYPVDEAGNIRLLDGDHICALFARFINEQFEEANSLGQPLPLKFGVVQTAYANGNSTRYFVEKLNLKPLLTKTGVKYLEEAAHNFDIGLYFEANGHGTVCFSSEFHRFVEEAETGGEKDDLPRYIKLLSLFSRLVNQVVGDGIADLLAVEFLLRYFGWSIKDWESNTYKNVPNVQLKVPVLDRSLFVTPEDNETRLLRPIGLQSKIDECVARYSNARAFIRPSGTEQIVRIYAEANSQVDAQQLVGELQKLVETECPPAH